MLVPFGVEDRRIFECFEDEIVGRTDLKNSAALYGSMNAASSTRRQLMALPRPALADVAEILMVEPFRNLIDCFLPFFNAGFQPHRKFFICQSDTAHDFLGRVFFVCHD